MITAVISLVAEAAKAFNIIEGNMNRPDMIAAAIKKVRQKQRDAVDAAQAILQNANATPQDKAHAFEFIQKIES